MAKKSYRKMTPEERARQLANQKRLARVLDRRLERDGMTREEARRYIENLQRPR